MAESPPETDRPVANRPLTNADPPRDATAAAPPAWLARYPWVTFVAPFVIFILANTLEPTQKGYQLFGVSVDNSAYPVVYTLKIALTMAAIAAVWGGYRQFPFRVSPLAIVVGAVGVVLWVGICKLQLESTVLEPLGLGWLVENGQRSAFNPLEQWPEQPLFAYGFLAVRLWGLAIVVPLIEEFFLRGFAMRFVIATEWWMVPFGTLSRAAVAVGTLLPILMHPAAELLAVAVWFSLVTWLMAKTKNIWDCVAAHMVTNLLLGLYVIASGDWYFW